MPAFLHGRDAQPVAQFLQVIQINIVAGLPSSFTQRSRFWILGQKQHLAHKTRHVLRLARRP